MKKSRVRTGDAVKVISGAFSGKISRVVRVDRSNNFVYLEEISRKKFFKSSNSLHKEGDDEKYVENDQFSKKKKILIPIDISNVKKRDSEEKTT